MLRYVFTRLIYTVVVILGVSLLVFVITHVIGNPVNVMLPLQASEEERAQLKHQLGLDKPLSTQLKEFLAGMVRLDFGKSWWQQEPALQLALRRVPATFQLVIMAFTVAALISIPLGIIAAYRPGSIIDRFLTTTSLVGVCLPSFWVGLLLVITFAVKLGWFATSGYGTYRHIVLPVVTLAILPAGHMAQIMRFSMLDQLNQQYVTTARAKGLDEATVVFKHALKNAATAVLTMGGMDLGRMLAGETAAVEMVYAWPGFGSLILETIARQDFPLLQASVFVVAVIICLINLAVDLSYGLFDPRIRY
ncbi:MAG TPA: ABC transporter permease [Firmicutes bacterium]|nr:ABC transporter permease [Bacillota bacterium]